MNWGFSHGVFIYDHVRMIKQGLTHGSTPQQYDSGMTNHQRPAMSSLQLASPLQQDLEIIFQSRSLHPISNNMNLLAEEFDPSPFSLELISPTRNTCSVLDLFINCGARHEGYLLFDAQYIY